MPIPSLEQSTRDRSAPWQLPRPEPAALALLLGAVAVVVLGSLPVFLRTFINDDTTYALVGQKLAAGFALYRDAVDNKPPLIYATFAAAFALFGEHGVVAAKLAAILATIGSTWLVYLLGRSLLGRGVGALGAWLFACAAVSGVAEDTIAPNTEMFMTLFGLLALWLLCRDPRVRSASVVAAGAAAGVALLYRVQGLAVMVGLVVVLARMCEGRQLVRSLGLLALGWLLSVGIVVAYFACQGTLSDLWQWVVLANFHYIEIGSADGLTASKAGRVALSAVSQLPLIVAAALGLVGLRRFRAGPRHVLLVVLAQLVLALAWYPLGKRFYGHYLIPVLPFAALLGAWGLRSLRGGRWVLVAAALWAAVFTGYNSVHLRRSPPAAERAQAVRWLRANTVPGDQVLLWGGSPLVAFESGRDFATRFLFNNYLTGRIFGTSHVGTSATRASNRALESPLHWSLLWQDLERSPPRVVLDGGVPGFGVGDYPDLARYVAEQYHPPRQFGATRLYLRREGR
jgi:4-amino-4-deoxy-L-arabinose transferase-like glycosyltransferase